ncbi:hypothetical protein BIWAKO_06094 [Bosea sp. BIWAKO-01]|nr:hypothetical protein BIWAKO_06094 [Bosea sp. BIWAKO-01]
MPRCSPPERRHGSRQQDTSIRPRGRFHAHPEPRREGERQ